MGFLSSIAGSLVGGLLDIGGGAVSSSMNTAAQKEFAQHGIRWKVADAKAAGIHPLYALGASTVPYTAGVGDVGSGISRFGDRLGQDISRAIDAKRTLPERVDARVDALRVERAELENDLLRSQISKINQAGHPPPLPSATDPVIIPGQGDSVPTSGVVIPQPAMPTASQPGRPAQEAGAVPDFHFSRTKRGYAVVPSADVKQRIEDTLVPEMMWNMRNLIIRNDPVMAPPKSWLPKGYDTWRFDPTTSEYVPARRRGAWPSLPGSGWRRLPKSKQGVVYY